MTALTAIGALRVSKNDIAQAIEAYLIGDTVIRIMQGPGDNDYVVGIEAPEVRAKLKELFERD